MVSLSRPTAMQPDEIRDGFLALHGEVTHLLSEVLRKQSRWTVVAQPWELRKMERRFAALSQRFDVLDSQLVRHMRLPKDYDAFRTTATFDLYGAVREAVRAKLSDTNAALGSLRTQVDLRRSLAVSVIGVLVTVALVAAIVVMLL